MRKEHKCLTDIRDNMIKSDPKIKSVVFEAGLIGAMIHLPSQKEYKTGQPIRIRYSHKKRSGDVVTKSLTSFVTHIYCPFCGKKYE